jgi:hypothetical protein
MKKIFLSIVSLFVLCLCQAQNVTPQEAKAVAKQFLESQGKTLVRCAKIMDNGQEPLLYIFNAENGFVVVSGDKSVPPVLSFSDYQLYNDSDVVPPFEMWINHYANQIDQIKKQHIVQPQYVSQWNELLSGERGFRTGDEVKPLLQSKWDQGEYYNYYCPRDPAGQNGRVVTGCVATAMGQLLYYFRFPETGIGSYSYTDEHYGVQSADYGNTTYDYNAMCDVPSAINPEISKLIYHCGVGVDMHYGPDGSGMTNHSAARVLRTYFKFSPETEYLFRDSTDLNWDSVIVSHLNRRIPMYYAGWSVPDINGHGFICDGYKIVDSAYFFHFNFGWSGYMDNYYYTNSLMVGNNNFNLAQELIINGYPDTTQYSYPVAQPLTGSLTLTASEGTFTDGSRPEAHCPAGMDFTWNIQPETSNLTDVSLTVNYELAAGDTLYVTNPNVNTFEMRTADTGTMTVAWGTTELTVHLFTHTSESGGFRASYTSNQPTFCSKTKTFSSISGHIEDGSGSDDYNNLSFCKFKVVLGGQYSAISVHINSLDLEEGKDFLSFYDNTISETTHYLTLTGQKSDTSATFDTRRLLMVFETDETGTAQGFNLDYTGGYVGITSYAEEALQVYPNPANDRVTVTCISPIRSVEIRDAEGRIVLAEQPDAEETSLRVAQLPAGIYLLTARTKESVITRKIVKL